MKNKSTWNRKINIPYSSLICLIGNFSCHFISKKPLTLWAILFVCLFISSQHLWMFHRNGIFFNYADKYRLFFYTFVCLYLLNTFECSTEMGFFLNYADKYRLFFFFTLLFTWLLQEGLPFLQVTVWYGLFSSKRRCRLMPGLETFTDEGNGYPLRYSCLGNRMGRAAWWATVHGATKSRTQQNSRRPQSVSQFSRSVVSESLWPHGPQHARLRWACCGACSDSCPASPWCYPAISSSVVPFSSCLQTFPASASFPLSQLFASGSQSIGVSASASVLPMNIQDWFPLGWTGWISLQSKTYTHVQMRRKEKTGNF